MNLPDAPGCDYCSRFCHCFSFDECFIQSSSDFLMASSHLELCARTNNLGGILLLCMQSKTMVEKSNSDSSVEVG